jgi:hypothetical protein
MSEYERSIELQTAYERRSIELETKVDEAHRRIYAQQQGITDLKNVVEELIVDINETLFRMGRVKKFVDRKYVAVLRGRIDTLELIKYLLERLIYTTNR